MAVEAGSIPVGWSSKSNVFTQGFTRLAVVTGQIAKLTQDDQHSQTGQETGHDRVGDEPCDRPQF